MKSLRRFTPLVRIRRSSGGFPAVNRCASTVAAVMLSGSGYVGSSGFGASELSTESGWSVALEEMESSSSAPGTSILVGEASRGGEDDVDVRFRDRSFWAMRLSENGRFGVGRGVDSSATVERIAVVISSREVYGKQMLRMALTQVS